MNNLTPSYPLSLPASKPLITLTHPEPAVWVIELHNGDDSRLTETLILDGLMPALDTVERDWRAARRGKDYIKDAKVGAGSLVIVGNRKQDKFFSNGLDYVNISNDTNFFPSVFNPLMLRLLFFPLPTIAALNGHCFAAGFVLAMTCDYRVIMSDAQRRVWMSMNEVHFGAPWPLAFAKLFRAKVGDARVHRAVALEGQRITPKHAKDVGLVDEIVGTKTEEVLNKAMDLARQASQGARSGVWGLIKHDLYKDVWEASQVDGRVITPEVDDARALKARL